LSPITWACDGIAKYNLPPKRIVPICGSDKIVLNLKIPLILGALIQLSVGFIVWKENTAWRCSYGQLMSAYKIARCHQPDHNNLNLHCLKFD
jgi:hypothetical protein